MGMNGLNPCAHIYMYMYMYIHTNVRAASDEAKYGDIYAERDEKRRSNKSRKRKGKGRADDTDDIDGASGSENGEDYVDISSLLQTRGDMDGPTASGRMADGDDGESDDEADAAAGRFLSGHAMCAGDGG